MSEKRQIGAYSGRLVSMPGGADILRSYDPTNPTVTNVLSTAIFIEFPAMPDEFELKRSATYYEKSNPFMPDGVHVYQGTEPLHLDFSFKLHHADTQYCARGPYTLLDVAARLHAMVLPINTGKERTNFTVSTGWKFRNDLTSIEVETEMETPRYTSMCGVENIQPPTVCQLELMHTGPDRPGIVCRGYVKDVSVKFIGPYMRGVGNIFNLPTAAEYSFTFIHRPGHSNVWGSRMTPLTEPQAYANDMMPRLYNTRDLVIAAHYQGIENRPSTGTLSATPASVAVQKVQASFPTKSMYLRETTNRPRTN